MKRSEFIRASLLVPLAPVLLTSLSGAATAVTVKAAEFVEKAGIAGQFEIDSSKLAVANAKNPEVKSFAERMIKDHTAAGEELKATVGTKYKMPAKLDATHQKMMDKLTSARAAIDAPYVKMQIEAHKQAVELFSAFGNDGDDAALNAYAMKTLPTLKTHYDMIRKIKVKS